MNINFEEVLNRISFTTNPKDAANNIDLVSESVTEDIELKKKVWAQFGELCPPHTLFTTNTSYLLPSQFAKATSRPTRFCAFHFHDVFVANVVDIMPHPTTEPWVTDLLMQLGKRLHQTPILVAKESNGYIFNFMLINILSSAATLLIKGVGSIEDIDRSWMGNFKTPIGPFGMMDQVGLDTAWHIISAQNTIQSKDFQALLQSYIDQNKLGIKNGTGFYNYPGPKYQEKGFVSGKTYT